MSKGKNKVWVWSESALKHRARKKTIHKWNSICLIERHRLECFGIIDQLGYIHKNIPYVATRLEL